MLYVQAAGADGFAASLDAALGAPVGLDEWRASFQDVHDIAPQDPATFVGRSILRSTGAMVILALQRPPVRLSRPVRKIRRDGFDHWELFAPLSGEVRIEGRRAAFAVAPGDLALDTMASSYVREWTAATFVTALLPREALPGAEALRPGPLAGPVAGALRDALASAGRRLGVATDAELEGFAGRFVAATAAAIQRPGTAAPEAEDALAEILRNRVRRVILQEIGSARLDVRRICRLSGLSRSALYRLFEGESGIAAMIQDTRLRLVRDDLRDPARAGIPIARIAEARGFHCIASFNRAFRRAYGCTPGEMRALAAAGAPVPTLAALMACSRV